MQARLNADGPGRKPDGITDAHLSFANGCGHDTGKEHLHEDEGLHEDPGEDVRNRPPSLLVIGSGPAGLALLRELSRHRGTADNPAVEFKCYDRQPKAGGMWTGDRRFSPM